MNQIEAKKQKMEYYSHVLGLIAFLILGRLIGNNGMAYMAIIIECISLFVLIAGGGVPDVIGRLIRSRRKKGQYKAANQLFKSIFIVQTCVGVVFMILYFFLAGLFAEKVLNMSFLTNALWLLTPIILLRVWQNILLGYFQGQGSHMPAVVCSIFRQLLFLLFSLLFTNSMVSYGEKVSSLLNNDDFAGMYGAFALCLAILIAEILVSLFLLIVYIGSDKNKEKKRSEDGLQKMDSFGNSCRTFYLAALPESITAILKKLPFLMCVMFALIKAEDVSAVSHAYGVFYIGICVLAIPVLCVYARQVSLFGRLTASVKRRDMRSVREMAYAGIHYSWAIGLYVTVFIAVMAPQLCKLLYKEQSDALQTYFSFGAVIVLLVIMNICLWSIQKIMGAYSIRYISLIVMNAAFGGAYLLLSGKVESEMPALCYAGIVAGVIMLILSFGYVNSKYGMQPDLIRCFIIPLVAAAIMGLTVMLVRNLLSPHIGNVMCLLLCQAVSGLVYLTVLVLTRSIKASETDYVYDSLVKRLFSMIIR